MICIECAEPIQCLYSKYKSNYIKATVCQACGEVADKYIEFDKVVLFLDLLLIKPQAYRHLVFNSLESDALTMILATHDRLSQWKTWFARYRKINRLLVLMFLFEVYLTWAYEERAYTVWQPGTPQPLLMEHIFSMSILHQYLYYILRILFESLTFHAVIQLLFAWGIGWGAPQTINYTKIEGVTINDLLPTIVHYPRSFYAAALTYIVTVSGLTKLFPILMLIWPYDTATLTTVITFAGNLSILEALVVVADVAYWKATLVLGIALLARYGLSKAVIGAVLGWY
ncbi:hypothetical protein BABINDRAFT_26451, partial [Babjeviella inositovora NRRL Y-12698]